MTSESAIAIAVLFGSGALVVGVQMLPPLTSGDAILAQRHPPALEQLEGFPSEQAFCEARLPGVDCVCFADKAGQILRDPTPEARGWTYADRLDLAMNQSHDSCR